MRNLEKSAQKCPFRDIPRTRAAEDEGSELTVAVLADDRNDNNAIVSQMTVLFAMLHNAVADLIDEEFEPGRTPDLAHELRLFDAARQTCIGIYRRIVENDLMRALLHPLVYERYRSGSGPAIDRDGSRRMPIEFALAMRFGHAMVRPHYRINSYHDRREQLVDVLLTSGRGRPWRMPLDESWIVQWSRFFAVSAQTVNHSRRIGPSLSTDLLSSLVFDRVDDTNAVGVFYRDLIFGALVPVPTVSALIAHFKALCPGLVESSPLLSDEQYRIAAFQRWLEEGKAVTGLSSLEIGEISRDPPLVAFVLLEAAMGASGRHLGVLGSHLIAEPIFGVLADSKNHASNAAPYELPHSSAPPGFSKRPFDDIKSMADLILFVAEKQIDAREIVPIV